MSRTTDMTKGSILRLLLNFSIPLIITNLGQQLYMIADAAIVGRGIGVKALAAVGSADWSYWLVLWSITGLTQGFGTFVSRYYGEKNFVAMNKTIGVSSVLCAIVGILMTLVGVVFARPLLICLDTPADILDGACTYLTTMISGTIIVTAYNMASSVLRALGDGKSPLAAMIIAGLLNIGLDLLFVLVFHWGIFGAAIASVLSQLVSFVYCVWRIKNIPCVETNRKMWKPDLKPARELMIFGIPLALQYVVIALGGMILQSTINLQGSIFVAGFTAVNKLYGLLESTAISFGIAFSTFFAQNYGAGLVDRVKKGVRNGIALCTLSAVVVMIIVFVAGRHMLMLFLDISERGGPQALEVGWKYLSYMAVFMVILYLIHVYRNALQGIGISTWSMISGFSEFCVRVFMGKVLIMMFGVETLFFIEPAAWLAALVTVIFPYYYHEKRFLQKIKKA